MLSRPKRGNLNIFKENEQQAYTLKVTCIHKWLTLQIANATNMRLHDISIAQIHLMTHLKILQKSASQTEMSMYGNIIS